VLASYSGTKLDFFTLTAVFRGQQGRLSAGGFRRWHLGRRFLLDVMIGPGAVIWRPSRSLPPHFAEESHPGLVLQGPTKGDETDFESGGLEIRRRRLRAQRGRSARAELLRPLEAQLLAAQRAARRQIDQRNPPGRPDVPHPRSAAAKVTFRRKAVDAPHRRRIEHFARAGAPGPGARGCRWRGKAFARRKAGPRAGRHRGGQPP